MKKIKNSIAQLSYRLILLFVKFIPAQRGENHLLIIKTDEIGDYILFRNLFKYFKESDKLAGHKITMIGNIAWKSLYDEYDQNTFAEVIWLQKTKFKQDLLYRFSFLAKIRQLKPSITINCVFSRGLNFDDGIAFVTKSATKLAMSSDNTNRGEHATNYDKLIYTEIINAGDEKIFDSIRNKNFVEKILQLNSLPIDTKLAIVQKSQMPTKNFFVLFIGAGNPERKWPVSSFVDSAHYANKNFGLVPVVCGGPPDQRDAEEFMSSYKREAFNLCGRTTLPFLMELLSNAQFLICVDTGALHMAAAVGCPVIGLYSGKFYGRFAPYPKEITMEFYAVYPDFVDNLISKKDPKLYNTFIMKNDTMKLIPPQKIEKFMEEIIARSKNQ